MINFKTSYKKESIKKFLSNKNISEIKFYEKNFFNLNKLTNMNENKFNSIFNGPIFPNRLFLKITSIINNTEDKNNFSSNNNNKIGFIYNQIINLYTIFYNKNINLLNKNNQHFGIIEPSSKEILNNKINTFISTMSKKNTHINNLSLNQLKIENKNLITNSVNNIQKEDNMSSSLRLANNNKKSTIGATKFLIGSISKFNSEIPSNQFLIYNYHKANKFNAYPFKQVFKLLTLTFLSMGCFISKPNIKVSYKPSINNTILSLNNKNSSPNLLQINEIIKYWSKKQVPNINLPLSVKNKVNYHKKITIQLFYYIRSENTIFSYLKKLALRYKIIQKLILNTYNSDPLIAKNNFKNMDQYLTEVKDNIRDEQKNIIKLNILRKYTTQFKHLGENLASLFNGEVELELIRLKKPYNNSHILVQNLSVESYHTRFVKLASRLFHKINFKKNLLFKKTINKNKSNPIIKTLQKIQILSLNNNPINSKKVDSEQITVRKSLNTKNNYSFPSYLSGMNIKLGGRTFKQRVIPRMTQKRIQKGSLNRTKVLYYDRAKFTNKTKKGAYTFTVKIGHTF